jgi:peptide/nickel transport system permease protein
MRGLTRGCALVSGLEGERQHLTMRGAQAWLRRLYGHKSLTIGGALFLCVVLFGLLAPLISPYDPLISDYHSRLQSPNLVHWLGTDHFGRDLLSRVIYGTRLSLVIGFLVVLINGLVGTTIGAMAGYSPFMDGPLMRLMDALMAFPAILLAMVISAVLGASTTNTVIALSVATIPYTARIVRAAVMVISEQDYIKAARALGASDLRIVLHHIMVNAVAPLIVRLTYVFALVILSEAALSYVGAGPPPPTPTLGGIITQGSRFMTVAPWVTIFPGTVIVVAVLALNLLGDGLRDFVDPRTRRLLK